MALNMKQFTPYDEVNGMLAELLTAVCGILSDNFVGMYLYGSLVTGDFSLETSDIDFLVAMREPVDEVVVAQLKEMHGRLAKSDLKWGNELEGYYVHLEALRRYGALPDGLHPHRERGEALKVEGEDEAFQIMRYILWHKGEVLAGPPIRELIDFVSQDDLRQAVRDLFVGWWRPQITDHRNFGWHGYRAYAVGTMCRMLYTLRFGKIVSKLVAGEWALGVLDEQWQELVETAVYGPWEGIGDAEEVAAFIGFIDQEFMRLESGD